MFHVKHCDLGLDLLYKLMVNKREAADIDDIYDYVQALAMYNMPEAVDLDDPRLLDLLISATTA